MPLQVVRAKLRAMELVLATEAQKVERDRVTHSAWGQRLTVAQYLERERRLRGHAFAKAAMRTWFLVGDEVLGSCETFAMDAWNRGEPGVVEGVASVFVEERLRGRGLASELFQKLLARLREERALASILYSDVGEGIYARLGYVARPAFERVWPSEPGAPAGVFGERAIPAELALARRPDDVLLVWPSAAQLDWHLERERAYAALLGRPRLRWHGAVAGNARAFWCGDFKNERLMVLAHSAARADELGALVQAARRVAHQASLPTVVLWECGETFELGGERVARTESLPMICPLRPGLDAHAWTQTSRATWI